ncbi:sialidase family protein [Leptothrix discophora]|uniref:exo-alpha-sialidase n=1 Tax=Leptothrix discophora TaxID=89 RepID=A0ABT9G2V3_LEPDI|nr:sialidase family protein [Leptothrix discophora]MDP4300815.1 sialidase family protein [Leptothrix discophora]
MNPKYWALALTTASGMCAAANGIGAAQATEEWVFRNGMATTTGVPRYACYRIPAVVTLSDGTLLAFAEGRQYGCGDHDANIDVVMRRRTPDGVWGPVQIVADHGGRVTRNPAPVVDRHGKVHLVYNVNYNANDTSSEAAVSESSILADRKGPLSAGQSDYRAAVYYRRSADGGLTWTDAGAQALNIDAQVHPYAGNKNYSSGLWGWYAMTPGHAIELADGKLLFPANHSESSLGMGGSAYRMFTHAVILDPASQTFTLGGTVGADTNESSAAQLDGGQIYMTMRNYHRSVGKVNAVSFSEDGGVSWMGGVHDYRPNDGSNYWKNLGYDPQLISPLVESSVLSFSRSTEASMVSRLVFSNPANDSSRIKGTLRVSYDEGVTWSTEYVYQAGSAAYSDLVATTDHQVGILHEAVKSGAYTGGNMESGLLFTKVNLEAMTAGKDSWRVPAFGRQFATGVLNASMGKIASESTMDPDQGDFSVSVSFALRSTATLAGPSFLARKGNRISTVPGWGLFIEDGYIKFRALGSEAGAARLGIKAAIGDRLSDRSVKHTVTAQIDRVSGVMSIHLDGVRLDSSALYTSTVPPGYRIQTSDPLVLAGSDGVASLSGLVFDVRVHALALSTDTIALHARSATRVFNHQSKFKQDHSGFWKAPY